MKKFFLLIFCVLFSFLIMGGIVWWFSNQKAVNPLDKTKIKVTISKGESVSEISLKLKEKNLIRDPFHFKVFVFIYGVSTKIQAGGYYLNPSMSEKEISLALMKGSNDTWTTIVEGLRVEQIGEFLIKNGFSINPKEWMAETSKMEGTLFPDSYFFPQGATQGAILKIITKNFQKKVVENLKSGFGNTNLTQNEVLVLASIVEREAKTDNDRKIVAGILLRRLNESWPLQVDATVQYATGLKNCSILKSPCDWWPHALTANDLKIKSKYNTYLNKELPPAPICNPGISAISAVLNPTKTDFWYYISGKDGVMHYAKTEVEHAENIAKYLNEMND